MDLENQYYNSKALKEDDPKAALQSFQKVLDLEGGEKGEWGFKALKQMIKINFKLVCVKNILLIGCNHKETTNASKCSSPFFGYVPIFIASIEIL